MSARPAPDECKPLQLAAVRATVLDPGATFSVRAMLAELDAIEPLTAPGTSERGRVMQLRSVIENKAGREEDSLRHGEEALRIEEAHPFLGIGERMSLHYGIAREAERIGRCETAIPHYRAALPLMAGADVGTSSQLGTRQRLAFCLHEARRFAEAREINEAILAEAAVLFPPDGRRTFTARVNLAQNQYALGDLAAACITLERLLADAVKAQDDGIVDQVLFQLGVLAFEGRHPAEAAELMERRLLLARASGDQERIAAATEALAILHRKLPGAGHR